MMTVADAEALARPHPALWSLTVACYGGLSNRLRVLLSGRALAEATGRTFKMLWPLRNMSGAAYEDLFENDWGVVTQPTAPPRAEWLPDIGQNLGQAWFDIAAAPQPEIAVSSGTWLVVPEFYPSQAPLLRRCGELFQELRPIPVIRERVAAFRALHFRPTMIGVHLRRAEFLRLMPFSAHNTGPALAAIRKFLQQFPDAGLYLSTDDGGPDPMTGRRQYEGVREKLRAAFGPRVVWAEQRTLECGATEGVQDALVDLLLLRSTDAVVGTWFSSFTELAAFGRGVPWVWRRSGGYWRGVEWALRASGTIAWLRRQSQRHYQGRMHPLSLIQYYCNSPQRLVTQQLKRWTPGLFWRLRAALRPE